MFMRVFKSILSTMQRGAMFVTVAALIPLFGDGSARAEGDPAAYQAALPVLEQAGGGKACSTCFIERYAPAEFNKAFAVSKDGAYGGRWSRNESIATVREKALDSCRKKPNYRAEFPCVVFFENDRLVWGP